MLESSERKSARLVRGLFAKQKPAHNMAEQVRFL